MSHSVVCYPTPGKPKSLRILQAFAKGCAGHIQADAPTALREGAAAFYGAPAAMLHLWRQAEREGRERYYLDNAYLDAARGRFYRLTRNGLQATERLPAARARFEALRVRIEPWQRGGRHIVVCPQSDEFMRTLGGHPEGAGGWLGDVLRTLAAHTCRPIVVRDWLRDKAMAAATLQRDLRGAWALVTHMSAAANEALIAGVPVFVTGECAATPMASGDLRNIERPSYPGGRWEWACGLAGAQWTQQELASGAWRTP